MDARTTYLRLLYQWQAADCEVRDGWRAYAENPSPGKLAAVDRLEKLADRAHTALEEHMSRVLGR